MIAYTSCRPSLRRWYIVLLLSVYQYIVLFTFSRTGNPNLMRAFKLSLNLWVVIHWIGCVYYVLSEYEGLGSNQWVYPNTTYHSPFSR